MYITCIALEVHKNDSMNAGNSSVSLKEGSRQLFLEVPFGFNYYGTHLTSGRDCCQQVSRILSRYERTRIRTEGMDAAFHASDRTWISKFYFRGSTEIDFLRKWGKPLMKETLEEEYVAMKSNSEDRNSSSGSTPLGTEPLESEEGAGALEAIKNLGEEFFGNASGKKKGRKRKGKKTQEDMNGDSVRFNQSGATQDERDERDEQDESMDAVIEFVDWNQGDSDEMMDSDSDDSDSSIDMETIYEGDPEKCEIFASNYARINLGPHSAITDVFPGGAKAIFKPAGQIEWTRKNKDAGTAPEDCKMLEEVEGCAKQGFKEAPVQDLYGDKAMEEFFGKYQKNSLERRDKELKRSKEHLHRREVLRTTLGLNEKEFNVLEGRVKLGFSELAGTPIVDSPVATGSVMPLLAPPVPTAALRMSTALSIFVNFSVRPGPFQWKCRSVNEQLSMDIEGGMQTKKKAEIASYSETCDPREKVDKSVDALYTFVLYHQSGTPPAPKSSEPEFAVKISILGSQTLQELRNQFYCKSDLICGEIKGNQLPASTIDKDACMTVREANLSEGCAVFIGHTIYTNESSKGDKDWDYASALKVWASRARKRPIGPFNVGNMEDTRIIDLTFKHGFPYLFIHRGNCEHLLVIEQVRLLNSIDSPLRSSYPTILKSNFKTVYCYMDNKRVARYAVRNMDRFLHDPMLLCRECLESYCYLQSEKAYDFKLFDFLQFSAVF